jgi:LytR cell envelope-related transcriptional attenuator
VKPGSHAAGDGSFGRSAGIQAGRAVLLIGVALVIGFVLLHRSPGGATGAVSSGGGTTLPAATSSPGTGATGGTTTSTRTSATTATPLRAPENVKVLVANGTTTNGLAGRITTELHAKGYNTLTATDTPNRPHASIVYFEPGFGPDAASLASKLSLPATAVLPMGIPPPVSNLSGAQILVVAGPDLLSSSSTTSTT